MAEPRQHNPHFFARQIDGSVKIRLTFTPEEASLIEEAAGKTPLIPWIHQTLHGAARSQAEDRRKTRKKAPPPQ